MTNLDPNTYFIIRNPTLFPFYQLAKGKGQSGKRGNITANNEGNRNPAEAKFAQIISSLKKHSFLWQSQAQPRVKTVSLYAKPTTRQDKAIS